MKEKFFDDLNGINSYFPYEWSKFLGIDIKPDLPPLLNDSNMNIIR